MTKPNLVPKQPNGRQEAFAIGLLANPTKSLKETALAAGYSMNMATKHAKEIFSSQGVQAALARIGKNHEDEDAEAVALLCSLFTATKDGDGKGKPDNAVRLAACVKWLEIRGMAGKDHDVIRQVIQNVSTMHEAAIMLFVAPEKREAYLTFITKWLGDYR